jgi:hypothetical protein
VLKRSVQVGMKIWRQSGSTCNVGLFGSCDFKDADECQHPGRCSSRCIVMTCFAESVLEVIREAGGGSASQVKGASENGPLP